VNHSAGTFLDSLSTSPHNMIDDRSTQILVVCVIFFILSWISVGLRVYVKYVDCVHLGKATTDFLSRARLLKQVGWDDGAMLATLLLFSGYLICQLGSLAHGNGRRRETMTDATAQIGLMVGSTLLSGIFLLLTMIQYWFFCELFYTLATSMLKISVGLFFLRIANNKWHILIIKAIMCASAVLGITYFSIVLFQCHPISFWWDLNPDHHGQCLSASVMADAGYVVSALNSVADWTFGLLPIFIVKDLHMQHHQKVVVAIILGFAAVGSSATIIRLPYVWTLKDYKGEFLWRTADVAIWTTVEVGIGITAGNLDEASQKRKSRLCQQWSYTAGRLYWQSSNQDNRHDPWRRLPRRFALGWTFKNKQRR
jgi:hypothetical protein